MQHDGTLLSSVSYQASQVVMATLSRDHASRVRGALGFDIRWFQDADVRR